MKMDAGGKEVMVIKEEEKDGREKQSRRGKKGVRKMWKE